uniref:Calmodulin binding transcription activator 1 n=1 Tax=Pygocentrus nattereri TaxID=42514 RepID=A0A3B4E944_PYGNA
MWRAEGKWLPKTSRKGAFPPIVFCNTGKLIVLLSVSSDEHGHLKIYLPKKLLECLPKCSSLPKERHRWNTNEVRSLCTL